LHSAATPLLRCEVVLDQSGTTVTPGDQIYHAEKLGFHQRFCGALQRMDEEREPVNADHRFTEQRGIHRGGGFDDGTIAKSAAARAL